MIRSRIQIGDGEVYDTFSQFGFCHMDSDSRVDAPLKPFAVSSYPEEEGEHIYPKTVADAFDYEVKFIVIAPNRNMDNANARIRTFNNKLFTGDADGVRTYKTVTFWNYYTRVKVVGYPQPIAEPTNFYRNIDGRIEDAVEVTLKLRVTKPSLCDWNFTDPTT